MSIDQLIYDTAIADGMPKSLAFLITAQARLESGNYKHRFFTVGNNAFGYSADRNSKWQIKPGDLADNGIAIAQYRNVKDSVHELTSWIKRRQKDGQFPKDLTGIKTPLQYTKYLREGDHPYGGRSTAEYAAGITARAKLVLIDMVKGNGGLTGLVFIGLLGYVLLYAK